LKIAELRVEKCGAAPAIALDPNPQKSPWEFYKETTTALVAAKFIWLTGSAKSIWRKPERKP